MQNIRVQVNSVRERLFPFSPSVTNNIERELNTNDF
jgi:hypothetical protein